MSKRDINGDKKNITWKYCFICQKKNKNELKDSEDLLGKLSINLLTFWRHGRLDLNWEAIADLDENGEPNFYDSLVKNKAKFHRNCGKKYDNQKVQRLLDKSANESLNESKDEFNQSISTRSSQPKKEFASLFCAICSENDSGDNLHAAGSLKSKYEIAQLTEKWKEMATKVGNTFLLCLLSERDINALETYTILHATIVWFGNMKK